MEEKIKKSIDVIQKEHHGKYALMILNIASYLAPRDIHLGMFSTLVTDSENLKSAFDLLSKNSLISVNEKSSTFRISKWFQLTIRKVVKRDMQEILKLIVRLPYASLDYPGGLHHAIHVLKEFSQYEELFEQICGISNEVVLNLLKQSRLEEAYLFGDTALEILQDTVGFIHMESLILRTNLVNTFEKMSKCTKDVKFVLPILGNIALPPGSEEARVIAMDGMKALYKLDDLDQAVFLAKRLSKGEKCEDELNETTLDTWLSWAKKLRCFEDSLALSILRELSQKATSVLSPNDSRISEIKNTMLLIASDQNKHKENLKRQEDLLRENLKKSGMNDPKVLDLRCRIAISHTFLGDKKKALEMCQDVANTCRQLYGELHPRAMEQYRHVEVSLVHAGHYGKATNFTRVVYQKLKKAPGDNHKELMAMKERIAKLLLKQVHIKGKADEAERLFLELCEDHSVSIGPFALRPNSLKQPLDLVQNFPKVKLETLHSAAKEGKLFNLVVLILMGADVDAEDYEGRRPLHYAAENGSHDLVRTLLKNGAIYNVTDYNDKTPLQLTFSDEIKAMLLSVEYIFRDLKKGHPLVNKYISDFREIINAKDNNGHTLFHWAATLNYPNVIKQLLDVGAEVKHVSAKGNTPLHLAASKGHFEIVELLLQSVSCSDLKTFINAKTTNRGTTALHVAAENGYSNIVGALLRHGANYNVKTHEGETAMQLSKDQSVRDILKLTDDMFTSVRRGDSEVIEKLRRLEACDFEIVVKACDNENQTLLQTADFNGYKNIVVGIENIIKDI
ncbi:hypothetical protein NPIL_64701 [Nephila pilipes]|uniref:Uncharacterized protein n=1 Tax=Nephila pilipes TaxID=299642 RepID=A0A8X6NB56_NEPPI|nr:hypothetical protein NPIL_64701 [Nephila pilipes]